MSIRNSNYLAYQYMMTVYASRVLHKWSADESEPESVVYEKLEAQLTKMKAEVAEVEAEYARLNELLRLPGKERFERTGLTGIELSDALEKQKGSIVSRRADVFYLASGLAT